MGRDFLVLTAALLFASSQAWGGPMPSAPDSPESGSVSVRRQAFFGELHLHTSLSFDAWSFGSKTTPDEAYRFGRGETIFIPPGQALAEEGMSATQDIPVRRSWPLDFMAVTDHAEWMGVISQLDDPNSAARQTDLGKRLLKDPHQGFLLVAGAAGHGPASLPPDVAAFHPADAIKNAWGLEIAAANRNYIPGKFTTFIAYEWTSMAQGKYNLHRNVIFNSDHAPLPFTAADSSVPEKLWSYLEEVRAHGVDVIAIPHNGNVSGGLMYDWNDSDGHPIDETYAQRRALNEPLTEIVQNKGQSDTVPELSPNDEFANFEIFDHLLTYPGVHSEANGSYIRQAYGRGLVIQSRVGVNPFKYGVVGGSDFHNGLSTSDESSYASGPFGVDRKTLLPRGDAARRALGLIRVPARLDMDADLNHKARAYESQEGFSGGGLTGVWAEENTRGAIFAALKRKETFATSGTRIRLRMFGGWRFNSPMLGKADWVSRAYADGVAMGGDLPSKPPATAIAPRFIVQAIKDPDGANLDRIQIIKVWLHGDTYEERVFDVALSGGRSNDPNTGRAPVVGNTVDMATGRYTNDTGAPILTAVWTDPEFNAKIPAVYYARALEIPTPRWTTLLAIADHLPLPTDVPGTLQERAWSSPIWFTP